MGKFYLVYISNGKLCFNFIFLTAIYFNYVLPVGNVSFNYICHMGKFDFIVYFL